MFRKPLLTAVDLGAHSLKCAVVESGTGRIKSLWQGELVPERASNGQELQADDLCARISSLLKSCQQEGMALGRRVSTSIQGSVSGYLELPPLSPRELDNAVPSAACKSIAFPMKDVKLSFVTVPTLGSDGKKCGVFYVAALKKDIDHLRGILGRCNLDVGSLEPPELALAREFSKNNPTAPGEFVCLVHVGYGLTHVVVARNGYPYFTRNFTLAGKDFTYAFQMGLQSSWVQAEQYKLAYDATTREVPIEPFLTRWLNGVRDSVAFFVDRFPGQDFTLEKIVLSGGSAAWKGLDARLAEHMQVPVVVSGLDRLKLDTKGKPAEDLCAYKVAIGLALGD